MLLLYFGAKVYVDNQTYICVFVNFKMLNIWIDRRPVDIQIKKLDKRCLAKNPKQGLKLSVGGKTVSETITVFDCGRVFCFSA